jgi:fumarate reductase subunit D
MNRGRTSPEPFLWLLFSAGGVAAALAVPALLFVLGVAIPVGWVDAPSYSDLHALMRNPLTRLVLLALCALALVHAAHRLRHTVRDGLQLQRHSTAIAVGCYGAAAAGAALAAYLLIARL